MVRLSDQERALMGSRVKAARHQSGLTQRQVADAMGVSVMAVQNWEHGAIPEPEMREKLAVLFGRPEAVVFAEVERFLAAERALLEPV